MKHEHRFRRFVACGLLCSCVVFVRNARAEVGVPYDPGQPSSLAANPYLQSITDTPEPFGYWLRVSAPGHPRAVLNENGDANGDGPPSFVLNPVSGLPIVAWASNTVSGFDVVVSRFQNGAWTVPEVVAGSPAADELDPSLFLATDGTVHLLYWTDDGADMAVMHRSAPADLSSWSAATQVSEAAEDACRPTGVFHEGVMRVVYEVLPAGGGSAPKQIVVAREQAGSFVGECVATSQHSGALLPQVHSHAGRFWIDWIDVTYSGPADGEMAWKRLSTQGGWEATRYEPFASEEQREFHVRGSIRVQALQP